MVVYRQAELSWTELNWIKLGQDQSHTRTHFVTWAAELTGFELAASANGQWQTRQLAQAGFSRPGLGARCE